MNKLIRKTTVLVASLAITCAANAETYTVCFGINKYPTPVDASGKPLKDDKGNIVSCNLSGAVNDATSMRDLLIGQFKVKSENAHLVTDRDAGVDGFVRELKWLVATAKAGDQVVFVFSGHGSQLPDKTKPSGKASVIVLADEQLVQSDFFKKFAASMKSNGVNSTFIFDSCFSGGMSRQPLRFDGADIKRVRTRSLNAMIGTSGTPIVANGQLPLSARAHLESGSVLLKGAGIVAKSRLARGSVQGEVAFLFASSDQQTSSDLEFKDPAKKSHGLFTLMLELVLSKSPSLPVGEVVTSINDFITKKTEFKQRPGTEFSSEERAKRSLVFEN